jgi:hypothetical protein
MQQPSTRHRSFNTARVGFNYTDGGKSEFQLSFALLFSSIQHFLPKELSQIFARIPGGPHATFRAELFVP